MAFQQAYKYASFGNILHYSFGLAKWSSVLFITSSRISDSYFKFLICATFVLLLPKDFLLPLGPNTLTTQESELTKDIRKSPDVAWCFPQVPSQGTINTEASRSAPWEEIRLHWHWPTPSSEVNFLAPEKHWPNKWVALHMKLHQGHQVKWNRLILTAHVERFELSSANWPTQFHQSALRSCLGFQMCVMRSSCCSRKHVSVQAGSSPKSFWCMFQRNQPQP